MTVSGLLLYVGDMTDIEECERCDGTGYVVRSHPQWGQLSCPEDHIEVPCPDCRGEGMMKIPHKFTKEV